MASEDLSEEALYRVNPDAVTASDAARLLAEVRRRRALDLTAEEVEALRDLLNYLGPRVLREWKTTAPGMATLDKLLSHEPHDAHLQ